MSQKDILKLAKDLLSGLGATKEKERQNQNQKQNP